MDVRPIGGLTQDGRRGGDPGEAPRLDVVDTVRHVGVEDLGAAPDVWAAERGDAVALVADRPWAWTELAAAVRSAAAALHHAGVQPGDRVPVVDVGGPLALVALLAAHRIGAAAALMNPRLTGDEITVLRELAGTCDVAVAGDSYRGNLAGRVLGAGDVGVSNGKQVTAGRSQAPVPVDEGAEAVVLFTSGTTGLPKVVPVPTATLGARLAPYADPPETQVRLLCVPLHHVGGMIGALVSLVGGHTLVVQPRFDAGEWLRLVTAHGVQLTFVVPTMLARILDHPDFGSTDLSSLETVTYGAAPMPSELIERATEALPHVGFVNTFGQTETLGGITLSTPEDHRHPVRRTSVGKLVPGAKGKVVDPDSGDEVGIGAVGELHVRSKQNVGKGWQPTGDLVRVDADGYIYVVGRLSDTINRGGEKFGPVEVEAVLRQHPSVLDVAVAGVPDDQMGERVGAVIVARRRLTSDTLKQWCTGRLARYKTPEIIGFVEEVPLTDVGKVDRRAVVQLLTGATGG